MSESNCLILDISLQATTSRDTKAEQRENESRQGKKKLWLICTFKPQFGVLNHPVLPIFSLPSYVQKIAEQLFTV